MNLEITWSGSQALQFTYPSSQSAPAACFSNCSAAISGAGFFPRE